MKGIERMIERDRDVYVLACDNCGEEILGFQSCEQAQDYMTERSEEPHV